MLTELTKTVRALAVCSIALSWTQRADGQNFSPQLDTWNSSFTLSQSQIANAGLDNVTASNFEVAVRFEQTNWAGNSARHDTFYQPPRNSTQLPPGSILAVEEVTNTSLYTLPPNTGLSRILFQSETYNGSSVPASAFVLWPWMPRHDPRNPDKLAVVGWAHGASGCFGECAPSHLRNLWYQYSAPYTLALQGYVVVAPDYAGLGVTRYFNGTEIKHQALAKSHANDLLYSVQAAKAAFADLSTNFVLMGHSQGGYAAWAAAEKLVKHPVPGYLGTISGSPPTNLSDVFGPERIISPYVVSFIANGLDTIFPGFKLSTFLSQQGVRHLRLVKEISGCGGAGLVTLLDSANLRPDYSTSWAFRAFDRLMSIGRAPVAGPMLVLLGTEDPLIPPGAVDRAVNATCSYSPGARIEYQTFEGVTHVPVMYASQRVWLDWIADRFAGKEAQSSCTPRNNKPYRPVDTYQSELEFFLEYGNEAYQLA